MAAAASDELIAATDLADLLVKRGMPFREAHGVVAGLVRAAVDSGRALSELSAEELRAASEHLERDEVAEVLAQQLVARVEGLRGRDRARRACASSSRPPAGRSARMSATLDGRLLRPAGRSRSRATSSGARCATATPPA